MRGLARSTTLIATLAVWVPSARAEIPGVEAVFAVPGDASDRCFGYATAADGDRIVVGAYRFDDGRTDTGAAFVFVRDGGSWTLEAELVPTEPLLAGALYGAAVDIAGDTVVVGSPEAEAPPSRYGTAYVFRRNGDSWAQEAKLVASPRVTNSRFGRSIAIDGDTLVVGAFAELSSTGAVYVFERTGTTWTTGERIAMAALAAGSRFGHEVALDSGVMVVAIPAFDERGDGTRAGAAAIYRRSSDGPWVFDDLLLPPAPVTSGLFGDHVATSNGRVAVAQRGASMATGAIALFSSTAGVWRTVSTFGGGATSLAFHGERLAFATASASIGLVHVAAKDPSSDAWLEVATLSSADPGARALGYGAVDLLGDLAIAGACNSANGGDQDLGTLHVFDVSPLPLGHPCGSNPECRSEHCVDAVCCDGACGGGDPNDCEACASALGVAADGTCGIVALGTGCRAPVGPCDAQESCDGLSAACPPDALAGPMVECRPAAGPCDAPEVCAGDSIDCPADAIRGVGELCLVIAAEGSGENAWCGEPDVCDGANVACPRTTRPSGAACLDDSPCTIDEQCMNGFCIGRPAAGGACCDDALDCDDSEVCTADSCSESFTCVHEELPGCGVDASAMPDAGTDRVPRLATTCWYCAASRSSVHAGCVPLVVALTLLAIRRRFGRP